MTKKPHKHAELIKAWADGAEIEAYLGSGLWDSVHSPLWDIGTTYRIKPQPKPDVTQFCNLKLTFDSETGEIKSAEVLT